MNLQGKFYFVRPEEAKCLASVRDRKAFLYFAEQNEKSTHDRRARSLLVFDDKVRPKKSPADVIGDPY